MTAIKYKVELTQDERAELNKVARAGRSSARAVKRALALLKTDEGLSDPEIAAALSMGVNTVARLRKRFAAEGLTSALNKRPRPGQKRKLSGEQEARLCGHSARRATRRAYPLDTATACRQGSGDGLCRLDSERDCATATQKNELKPWKKKEWRIPAVSGEFVARMEDVLDLYSEERDPERPVVCFDETSKAVDGGYESAHKA